MMVRQFNGNNARNSSLGSIFGKQIVGWSQPSLTVQSHCTVDTMPSVKD